MKNKIILLVLLLMTGFFSANITAEEENYDAFSSTSWEEVTIAEDQESWQEYLNSINWDYGINAYSEEEIEEGYRLVEQIRNGEISFGDLNDKQICLVYMLGDFPRFRSVLHRDRRICRHYLGNGSGELSYVSMMSMDGTLVYCLEPYALLYWNSGGYLDGYWGGSADSYWSLSSSQKDELAKVMYYGYGYDGDYSDEMFVATQLEVWRVCGYPNEGAGMDVSYQRSVIQGRVSANPAAGAPSFNGQKVELIPNKTTTLTDTKGTLSRYGVSSVKGITLEKNGNSLNITMTDPTDYESSYSVSSGSSNMVSSMVIFQANGLQTCAAKPTTDPIGSWSLKFEVKTADVEIVKEDAETGTEAQGDAVLSGAEFKIVDLEGWGYERNVTADSSGSVKVSGLPSGRYQITETTAPNGYLLSRRAVNVDSSDGNAKKVSFYDEVIKGKIRIIKQVEDGSSSSVKRPGVGFSFEIYQKSTDTLVETITTDENGEAESSMLPYGAYVVKEVRKEGYYPVEDIEVEIKENDKTIPYILSNERISADLIIIKIDSDSGNVIPASGVSFKIRDASGNYLRQHVSYPSSYDTDTFVTDESGSVHLPESLPYGTYTIVEIQAPKGYVLSSEEIEFSVDENVDSSTKEIYVRFPDKAQKGKIEIEKKGEMLNGFKAEETEFGTLYTPVFTEKYLSDVTYSIVAREDIIGEDGTLYYKAGDEVSTLVTTEDGPVSSTELPLGKYSVTEMKSRDGYVRDTKTYSVDLVYSNQTEKIVTEHVSFYNEREKAEIHLRKQMEESLFADASAIQDVVLGLFTAEDIQSGSFTLPKNSLVALSEIHEDDVFVFRAELAGKYVIRELKTNAHYQISKENIPVSFTYAEGNKAWNIIYVTEVLNNNLQRGDLAVYKVDEYGNYATGSVFEVSTDEDFREILCTIETDENGIARAEGLEIGTYYVRETECAEVFELNTGSEPVQILFGEENTLSMENIYKPIDVEIIKKDDVYQEDVLGASFELYREREEGDSDYEVFYLVKTGVPVDLSDYFEDESFEINEGVYDAEINETLLTVNQPCIFTVNSAYRFISVSEEIEGIQQLELVKEGRDQIGAHILRVSDRNAHREPLRGAIINVYYDAEKEELAYSGITDEVGCIDLTLGEGTYFYEVEGRQGIKEISVDSDSAAVVLEELMQNTVYYLLESGIPEGYAYKNSPLTEIDTSLQEGFAMHIELTNLLRRIDVHVTKTEENHPENLLNGAVFEVFDETDGVSLGSYMSGKIFFNGKPETVYEVSRNIDFSEVLLEATSTKNGVLQINEINAENPYGRYYLREKGQEEAFSYEVYPGEFVIPEVYYGHTIAIREVQAPDGYYRNDEITEVFVITDFDIPAYSVNIENRKIILYKMGEN